MKYPRFSFQWNVRAKCERSAILGTEDNGDRFYPKYLVINDEMFITPTADELENMCSQDMVPAYWNNVIHSRLDKPRKVIRPAMVPIDHEDSWVTILSLDNVPGEASRAVDEWTRQLPLGC